MNYPNDLSPVIFSKDTIFLIREIFDKAQELENVSQQKCFMNFENYYPENTISFRQFYKIINSKTHKKLNFLTAQFLCKGFLGIYVKNSRDARDKIERLRLDEIRLILDNTDSITFLDEIRDNNKKKLSDLNEITDKKDRSKYSFKIPRNFIIYGFIIFCLSAVIYFALLNNTQTYDFNEITRVESEGNVLKAIDHKRNIIWQKDFKLTISKVFTGFPDKNDTPKYFSMGNKKFILLFLVNPNYIPFNPNISIISRDCDNRVVLMSYKGEVLLNSDLSTYFNPSLEFSRVSRVTKIQEVNVDNDNRLDQIFWITHNGMYPASFVLRKGISFFTFANSGHFSDYRILYANKYESSFLVLAYNNPIAHLKFISEIKFIYSSSEMKIHSIANISNLSSESQIPGFICFLPTKSKIINCSWAERGQVTLFDEDLNSELTVTKNNELRIKTGGKITVYKDRSDHLQTVYLLLDKFFKEKKLRKDNKSAYELILKALEYKIQNLFLKSAILYLKGDLEIENAQYDQGIKSLNHSLALYSFNNDSCQRLCEIEFLKNKPLQALKLTRGDLYSEDYHNSIRFWGLASGKNIFQTFCYLQAGDFESAAECAVNKTWASKGEYILITIPEVFKGNYEAALKKLKDNENKSSLPFTVAERRILYARTLLLKNLFSKKQKKKEIDRAKFYFEDLAEHSLSLDHLAKISRAYFLARENKQLEANDLAKTTFNKLSKLSRGNMITKLWLFYDAYIYAKTMDLLKNQEETMRGYQACINANPHTDLAIRAKEALRELDQ